MPGHGSPIPLGLANDKIKLRKDITDAAFVKITSAVQNIPTAKTFYAERTNAFIFDLQTVGRYFESNQINANYKGATHLLVIEGAHTRTAGNFGINKPTVVLAPVMRNPANEKEYMLVGNKQDAALEWPTDYLTSTLRDIQGNVQLHPSSDKDNLFFIIESTSTDAASKNPDVQPE